MRNVASLALVLCACGAPSPYCDGPSAEAALLVAEPGDTVELGVCEVMGPLHVPPGVTLRGVAGTVVVAPEGSGGVLLLGGAPQATVLEGVEVRVDGVIGVLARGGGQVQIRDVTVEARRGLGVGAAEIEQLTMSAVVVRGPITAANADESRWLEVQAAPSAPGPCPGPGVCECEPGDAMGEQVCSAEGEWVTWAATHGVFLSNTVAELSDVRVEGFAELGFVSLESDVSWSVGGVFDTLGVGLRASGGSLELTDVHAERTYQGVRGQAPYGVLAEGTVVNARGLVASDNDRYGVFLRSVSGEVEDARLEGNGDAALWISDSATLGVRRPTVRANAFAGVVLTGSREVTIEGGAIEQTAASERPVGTLGVLRVGDGVHMTGSYTAVVLEGLAVTGSERAGIVVDLGAGLDADVVFRDVQVTGAGAELGAIGGSGSSGALTAATPAGWDDGIERLGDALANDAGFSGDLAAVTGQSPDARPVIDVLSVVAPMF